ncbi:site-specific recombinase XerD [Shimia isoporae]|uniref:Site-specific recombinase XerD n=1 Tax=Shimia isoporae TaxID=647720 RepID=A0A4R1NNX7_9RHOB|nr:tyrosine-type recombinase/integrase [Shimia isoporae]TCL09541.1 site-specific recombinase XerD [Shimia isoporae]
MKFDIGKPLAIRAALKPHDDGKPFEISDTQVKGLTARVRRIDGQIIGKWNCRITIDGKTKRISLGDVNEMSGTEARLAAITTREQARQGQTIVSASTAAREAQREAEEAAAKAAVDQTTLHDLLFVDDGQRKSYDTLKWQHLKSGAGAARHASNFLADLLHKPAKQLTKYDLERVFLQKADTAPHSATRGLAYVRPALIFLMKREWVQRDVLDLVEDLKVKTVARERVLQPVEWQAIWSATGTELLNATPAGLAVKTLMMTGARNREVAEMRVDELHLDRAEWHLPTDRSKNADPHVFCLPQRAVEVLRHTLQKKEDFGLEDSEFVFTNDGIAPVWLGSKVKAQIDSRSGVTEWRFHDLRRTMATELGERGISGEIVDMMLNHRASASRGGVKGVYNRSKLLPQRHAAADRWGNITDNWIDGHTSNVVQIAG